MQLYKKTFLLLIAGMLSAGSGMAADAAAAAPADTGTQYNVTLISLVSLMIILLFVIGVLAGTLRQLSHVISDKVKADKLKAKGVLKAILLPLALTIPAIHSFAADAPAAAEAPAPAPAVTHIAGIPVMDFYFISGFLVFELVIIFAMLIYINILLKVIRNTPERAAILALLPKRSWFWDKFNAAKSLEEEKDIMLDHDYDGIKELDNSLPPWWKYGFYLTIVVGVIYLYRFHVSHDGLSQEEEFVEEMAAGEAAKAAYLATAANNVDESSVVMLGDPAAIGAGKDLFVKNCAACHLADGGGSVGPNLTDDYWLHGGGIKDVFKSIKYGWQDKGMKSWKDDFSPMQIQQLASFVKSLKGTHPATPKDKQGELYIEAAGKPAGADSSAAPTADSAKAIVSK